MADGLRDHTDSKHYGAWQKLAEQLSALGVQRMAADDAFAQSLNAARSMLTSEPEPASQYFGLNSKQAADAETATWNELWAWTTNSGDSAASSFLDGDPFTLGIQSSGHLTSVRDAIAAKLAAGDVTAGQTLTVADRDLGADPLTLGADFLTVATGSVLSGNLPEAFIGSFALSATVDAVNPDGSAIITYSAANDTTVESASRIPVVGGEFPWGPSLHMLRDNTGLFQNRAQVISWTEVVKPA